MEYKKKLIEVALPLEAINEASAREKSIRHGHPSTLHLWWARRPLAAARAVIWASLVDDPSSHPDQFPTEEEQHKERERLFEILEKLVLWENTNNQEVLNAAKAEILKSTDGNPPALYDPFAGGGAIPLEAQRLGLEAHASDLNPVAVMINKAMIEIPPKFAGQPPVNPEAKRTMHKEWPGASGLAEDVRYYGEWMKEEAFRRIGHLYPKVKDEHGKEHTVIAWIWARTVKCPNPACGCEMPLANSFELSTKKNKEAYVQPIIDGKSICFEVKTGGRASKSPKVGRARFRCICCDEVADNNYLRAEFSRKRSSVQLIAIVAEGNRGRLFFAPNDEHIDIVSHVVPLWKPELAMNPLCTDLVSGRGYGFAHWHELFTDRQLVALKTLNDLVKESQARIILDGGTEEYAQGISVYLAFLVDQVANHSSSMCGWNAPNTQMRSVFARQAIPMVWDFAESNVFSNSTGSYDNLLERLYKGFLTLGTGAEGIVRQFDAQCDIGLRNIMISTDPPYYDNINYSELSDFFYIWIREALKEDYPEIFSTIAVPKAEELIAAAYRFNDATDAREHFENGMFQAFQRINDYARLDVPITIYYAFRQSDTKINSVGENATISLGWEAILSAIIRAGLIINGTWPIRTEKPGRSIEIGTNALASSIVLVCRKRPHDAQIVTRRDFINALRRKLRSSLMSLQASNIAPVDMAQSAIGPGMGVYSRYSKVLEADGSPMSVRTALEIINRELDLYFTDQDGELDADSRFCIDLYSQDAFNDIKFGEADVLARAKNTSVDRLASHGLVYAQKGIVRLTTREELPKEINTKEQNIWLLTQQLTRALEVDGVLGVANIVERIFTAEPERAKALAYRLFTIAERKGWSSEAYAYNSLVIAWPEIQMKVAELKAQASHAEQLTIEGIN